IDNRQTNEAEKGPHTTTASPDSRSTASQMRFATGTSVARRQSLNRDDHIRSIQNCRTASNRSSCELTGAPRHARLSHGSVISKLAVQDIKHLKTAVQRKLPRRFFV